MPWLLSIALKTGERERANLAALISLPSTVLIMTSANLFVSNKVEKYEEAE
jgi:hypothetical protein